MSSRTIAITKKVSLVDLPLFVSEPTTHRRRLPRTDTSDASFMRKRGEAMEHLTKIEIQFAKLRDMLYVERMTEVEKDRIAIESGTRRLSLHRSYRDETDRALSVTNRVSSRTYPSHPIARAAEKQATRAREGLARRSRSFL